MQGVQYASGHSAQGDLSLYGQIHGAWRAAMIDGRAEDVEAGRRALDAFYARSGTRGRPMSYYTTPVQTRVLRPSTPTAAVRASSGGSTVLADIAAIRGQVAAMRRDAIQAGLAARRQHSAPVNARGVVVTQTTGTMKIGTS